MGPRAPISNLPQGDEEDDAPRGDFQIPQEITELEKRLRIDKYKMDDELEEHPDLFHRAGQEYMLARSRRDQLKLRKEQLEATLDNQVRNAWSDLDPKLTETGVRGKVMLMPKMKRMAQDYLDACTECDLWQAIKDAFDQRGYAIKDLCALYNSGYWSPDGTIKNQQGQARRNDPAYKRS